MRLNISRAEFRKLGIIRSKLYALPNMHVAQSLNQSEFEGKIFISSSSALSAVRRLWPLFGIGSDGLRIRCISSTREVSE